VKGTKTRKSRLVPVHPVLEKLLRAWMEGGFAEAFGRPRQDDELLFPSRHTGKPRAQGGIWTALQEDLDTLGLRTRKLYSTRRTHISLLGDARVPRDIFKDWTHGTRVDVISGYTTLQWQTLCEEMLKLPLGLPKAEASVRIMEEGADSAVDSAVLTPSLSQTPGISYPLGSFEQGCRPGSSA
jgi:integrase